MPCLERLRSLLGRCLYIGCPYCNKIVEIATSGSMAFGTTGIESRDEVPADKDIDERTRICAGWALKRPRPDSTAP